MSAWRRNRTKFVCSARVLAAVLPALLAWNTAVASENRGNYFAEIEKWRSDRETRLTSEDGWLTLVGLYWLKPGANEFGSDPESPVALPAGAAPARAGLGAPQRCWYLVKVRVL